MLLLCWNWFLSPEQGSVNCVCKGLDGGCAGLCRPSGLWHGPCKQEGLWVVEAGESSLSPTKLLTHSGSLVGQLQRTRSPPPWSPRPTSPCLLLSMAPGTCCGGTLGSRLTLASGPQVNPCCLQAQVEKNRRRVRCVA